MLNKRYILHIFSSCLVLALAVVGIGVAIVFARLSAQPLNLMPYLPKAQAFLQAQGYTLQAGSAWLSFDGSLNIDATDIRLEPLQYPAEAMRVQKVNLGVAPWPLLRGRLAFSRVVLNQPQLPVTVTKSAMRIMGRAVAFKQAEQPADFVDVLEMLNNRGPWGYVYRALTEAQIVDGLLEVQAPLLPGENLLQGFQLSFKRNWGVGETMSVKGLLTTSVGSVPLYLSADHPRRGDTLALRLRVEDASTALLDPFLPPFIQHRAAFTVTTDFQTQLGRGNKLVTPQLGIKAHEVTLNIPEKYKQPLRYTNISGLLGYSGNAGGTLYVKYLNATDAHQASAVIEGNISHLFTTPDFNLTAKVPSGGLASILQYIPDGKGYDWVAENIPTAQFNNASVGFHGQIIDDKLNGEAGRAYFHITGDIHDVAVNIHEGLPHGTDISGRYEWLKDDMHILVHQGRIGGQEVRNVAVDLKGVYADDPLQIRIVGTATGESQQALAYTANALGFKSPVTLRGQHISAVSLSFPAMEGLTLADTVFKSSTDLLDMETDLPLKFGHLVSNNAVLDITQLALEFNSSGFLNEQPITLYWWEDLRDIFRHTKVEVNGQIDAAVLQDYLPLPGSLGGILGSVFTLEQTDLHDYKYTLAADLADTHLTLPAIGWEKPGGEGVTLSAIGNTKNAGKVIVADALSIKGKNVDVQGRAEINTTHPAQSRLDFTALKFGQTDTRLQYKPDLLSLQGKSFYLGDFDAASPGDATGEQKKQDRLFDDGKVTVRLGRFIRPHTEVRDLQADFTRAQGWWRSGKLTAQLAGPSSLQLEVQTTKAGTQASLASNNAAEAIKLLETKADFTGGTLEGSMMFSKDPASKKTVGKGHVHIKDMRVLNAPILFKLLQVLSLEVLTSPGEGLLFDSILVPLTYDGNIHLKDAKAKGPTLGLKGRGDINLEDREMNLKGTVIPVRGLNQAVGKIPLIGPLLTGSQEALIAADFTVKGSFDDPKISMNPLSLITPGLIKDIFR